MATFVGIALVVLIVVGLLALDRWAGGRAAASRAPATAGKRAPASVHAAGDPTHRLVEPDASRALGCDVQSSPGVVPSSIPGSCLCTGPLAQLAEQWTFNPWVVGSSPTGPT